MGRPLRGACFSLPACTASSCSRRRYFVELGLPALIERPEHFYGFIGVALAWQFVFLIVASDVVRYRPLMLAWVLEKLSFGAAVAILYSMGRVSIGVQLAATVDLVLGALFVAAFVATRASVADITTSR